MKIDFVSDIACPWCAVGLHSLEQALRNLGGAVQVDLHFQPFELNPAMPPEGEDTTEHLTRKYGLSPEQLAQGRAGLRQRGADVGFTFGERPRIWNTFDAHRLLYWAGLDSASAAPIRRAGVADAAEVDPPAGRQRALKHALLAAYHTHALNPGDADVLVCIAGEVGLDAQRARAIVESDEYAAEVRALERHYQELGIHSVPSIIINERHLIQGGQPPELFERALRQIAATA